VVREGTDRLQPAAELPEGMSIRLVVRSVARSGSGRANTASRPRHNNDYEPIAANACAVDGSVAQDQSTGTDAVNSCTDIGKDRYTLGLRLRAPGNGDSCQRDPGAGRRRREQQQRHDRA
jgi:hypothetical protein